MAFCANCGKEMSDQAVACPNCGHPRGGAAVVGKGKDGTAEWWKRLVAFIIDVIILSVANSIAAQAFSLNGQIYNFNPTTFSVAFATSVLLGAAISFLYFGIMNGSARGQTVGKMVMKICVRDFASGGPIGIGRGMVRTIIYAFGGFTCGILTLVDGLWPLWDEQGQALHDKMAQSRVVDVL